MKSRRKQKRVCLLTGASGALGTAFCRNFAADYHIVGVYRTRLPDYPSQEMTWLDPLAPRDEIPENDNAILAIQADLLVEDELRRIVSTTLHRFRRIDLLVNAAARAVFAPMRSSITSSSMTDQFVLNTVVPLKLAVTIANCYWSIRAEENADANRNIVNVSSTAGLYVYSNVGQSVYAASKAALNMLTCHMSAEMHDVGIRVNALAPGSFSEVEPDRVAQAIVDFDRGDENGRIRVLDGDEDFMLD